MSIKSLTSRLAATRAVLFHDNFIVVTDKFGRMGLTIGGDVNNAIDLANMRAALVQFKRNVNDTIKDLDNTVDKELGEKVRKTGRKIKVTEE